MPKTQKHYKLQEFYAWTVPKNYETFTKNRQKPPNKDFQNASSNFTIFFPTPNPEKRENLSTLKDFRKGRVAKAMRLATPPNGEASRNGLTPWCRRPPH